MLTVKMQAGVHLGSGLPSDLHLVMGNDCRAKPSFRVEHVPDCIYVCFCHGNSECASALNLQLQQLRCLSSTMSQSG